MAATKQGLGAFRVRWRGKVCGRGQFSKQNCDVIQRQADPVLSHRHIRVRFAPRVPQTHPKTPSEAVWHTWHPWVSSGLAEGRDRRPDRKEPKKTNKKNTSPVDTTTPEFARSVIGRILPAALSCGPAIVLRVVAEDKRQDTGESNGCGIAFMTTLVTVFPLFCPREYS